MVRPGRSPRYRRSNRQEERGEAFPHLIGAVAVARLSRFHDLDATPAAISASFNSASAPLPRTTAAVLGPVGALIGLQFGLGSAAADLPKKRRRERVASAPREVRNRSDAPIHPICQRATHSKAASPGWRVAGGGPANPNRVLPPRLRFS